MLNAKISAVLLLKFCKHFLRKLRQVCYTIRRIFSVRNLNLNASKFRIKHFSRSVWSPFKLKELVFVFKIRIQSNQLLQTDIVFSLDFTSSSLYISKFDCLCTSLALFPLCSAFLVIVIYSQLLIGKDADKFSTSRLARILGRSGRGFLGRSGRSRLSRRSSTSRGGFYCKSIFDGFTKSSQLLLVNSRFFCVIDAFSGFSGRIALNRSRRNASRRVNIDRSRSLLHLFRDKYRGLLRRFSKSYGRKRCRLICIASVNLRRRRSTTKAIDDDIVVVYLLGDFCQSIPDFVISSEPSSTNLRLKFIGLSN